jgi:hypothetical protein
MTQKMTSENRPSETASAQGAQSAPVPSDIGVTQLRDGLAAGARELSTEVRHVAVDLAGEAKKTAESKLGEGKDFAAEHLGSVADALRKTSRELRANESAVTDYVDMAASSVEKVSAYVQTRTLSQLMGDAEVFARREPAVFLGGAFFLGMLGGRFLKSASPARPQERGQHRVQPIRSNAQSSSFGASRDGASGGSHGGQKGIATGTGASASGPRSEIVPSKVVNVSSSAASSAPKPGNEPSGANRPNKSSGVS